MTPLDSSLMERYHLQLAWIIPDLHRAAKSFARLDRRIPSEYARGARGRPLVALARNGEQSMKRLLIACAALTTVVDDWSFFALPLPEFTHPRMAALVEAALAYWRLASNECHLRALNVLANAAAPFA